MSASAPATVAVLDVGKTNVKLNAVTADGRVVDAVTVPNPTREGPPWRHHDLAALSDWLFPALADLCRRHPIEAFVASGHGSGGVLVGDDPDDGDGAVLPMIDYEQPLPEPVREAYLPLSGDFFDRGSAVMMGATHQARQLLWMQAAEPEAFARGRHALAIPQYWAWRLSGIAASETTALGAQSQLWNTRAGRWSPIVAARGWQRLMPPFAPAHVALGRIRAPLRERHGLPPLRVLCGIHDSSANVYRYQAAGLDEVTVLSTGTWLVGLSRTADLDRLAATPGGTCNADVAGRPVGGVLTMGGREYARVAGPDAGTRPADPALIAAMVARGTVALPSFGTDDGLFPGSAGRGRIEGPPPETADERRALAVLYAALLADECLATLGARGLVVIDGGFLRDPAFAALVAALRPDAPTRVNFDTDGVAAGAALLAGHAARTGPAPLALADPAPAPVEAAALAAYAARWRSLSRPSPSR